MRSIVLVSAFSLLAMSCSSKDPASSGQSTGGAGGQTASSGGDGSTSGGGGGAENFGGTTNDVGGSVGAGGGSGGQLGTGGAAVSCDIPKGAWIGSGRTVYLPAECTYGADKGDCHGCATGSASAATKLENKDTTVGYFDSGAYLAFSGVDLTGLNALNVMYATENGGIAQVRLDSKTGTLIGTWEVIPTGNWTGWSDARIKITPVEGKHDIYIVGTSGTGIANFDYLTAGVCTPKCGGKTCGDDGCGGSCGTCTGSDFCDETNNCHACVPNCDGKQCGDDTCGGVCGTECAAGSVCAADRTCIATTALTAAPRLHVNGRVLQNPAGTTVIVKGVSLIDIGQQYAYRDGLNAALDRITGDGWGTKIVRLPVYPTGKPFPFPLADAVEREKYMKDILRPAVDYATKKGLYVIIDWHEISNVTDRKDADAKAFWTYMAPQFANYPNVIYELFNEPMDDVYACVVGTDTSCWPKFKAKAQGWVDIVRKAAPDSLILVGGSSWSQVIGPAAEDPINDANVAYVGHIYPQHVKNDYVVNQIKHCAEVHPVIVTEWGYGFDAKAPTADKEPYITVLKPLLDDLGLSWTAWVADSQWGPPMYTDNAGTLSDFGEYAKSRLAE